MANKTKIDKRFITALNAYAKQLEACSVWKRGNRIVGNVLNGKDDFIYEFYCYMSVIFDIKQKYKLSYIPGSGAFTNCFPMSPALKAGRPRFNIENPTDGNIICQVCAGTKIKVRKGNKLVAPDISFQIATSSDNPVHTDVLLIMDAKYKTPSNCNKSLHKNIIYSFSGMVKDLKLKKASKNIPVSFTKFAKINHNSILTNSSVCGHDKVYLSSHKLRIVYNLDHTLNFKIK